MHGKGISGGAYYGVLYRRRAYAASTFFEMAEYASRLGFVVGLTTNGTLITGDTAERIVRSGIRSVSVSMDGEEHSHDMLRAVPGAFERAASGIRELTEYSRGKVSVQITTVFTK